MPLTPEQMVHAVAAQRMIEDKTFQAVLDHIVKDSAERTVWGHDEAAREASRQQVLAIARIRGEIEALAQAPQAEKDAELQARAME